MKGEGGLALALLFLVGLIAVGYLTDKGDTRPPITEKASPVPDERVCELGTRVAGRFFPTANEIEMYVGPGQNYPKVVNQIATSAIGHTQYQTLWKSEVFDGRCIKGKWLKGKIVEADGAPVDWQTGWVLKKYLRSLPSPEQNAGLVWDIATDPDIAPEEKAMFRKAALKILKDVQNCKKVTSGNRGPVTGHYFVTCMTRDHARWPYFNVRFTRQDLVSGKLLSDCYGPSIGTDCRATEQ